MMWRSSWYFEYLNRDVIFNLNARLFPRRVIISEKVDSVGDLTIRHFLRKSLSTERNNKA